MKPVIASLTFAVIAVALTMFALAASSCNYAHSAEIAVSSAVVDIDVAREHAAAARKPLLVLVGAEWCPACNRIEAAYGAKIASRGVYVHLDWDRHPKLIRRLGLAIVRLPTLIVVEGAKRRVFVGVDQIRLFLLSDPVGDMMRTQRKFAHRLVRLQHNHGEPLRIRDSRVDPKQLKAELRRKAI